MSVTDFENNLDALVAMKRLTGLRPWLGTFDRLTKLAVKSDDEIVIQITAYTVTERRTEYVLTERRTKLISYKRSPAGVWREDGKVSVPDPDFTRETVPMFGAGKSPAEWLAAKEFARMCNRPGSSRVPMDSYRRVMQGVTTRRMARHYG